MNDLEKYLNTQWGYITTYLQQCDYIPQVIRYHAQLDLLAEFYCHFCCDLFDFGYDNLSIAIDRLANQQIHKIQSQMTIHDLCLFD